MQSLSPTAISSYLMSKKPRLVRVNMKAAIYCELQ